MENKMSELDRKLADQLLRRKEHGVLDIKCHVEVTSFTEASDVKLALSNVLDAVEKNEVPSYPLRSLNSFDDLMKLLA